MPPGLSLGESAPHPTFLQHRSILVPYRKIAERFINSHPDSAKSRRRRQTLCASEVVRDEAKLVKPQAAACDAGREPRMLFTDCGQSDHVVVALSQYQVRQLPFHNLQQPGVISPPSADTGAMKQISQRKFGAASARL